MRVTVVTRWAPGLPRRDAGPKGTVRRVGNGWASPLASARFIGRGAAAIIAARPAVVHAHDLLSATLCGAGASSVLRVPLVAKVASTGPGGDLDVVRRRPGGAARLRLLLPRIAAFACVSTEVVESLQAAGVPADRCVLLPNGVDIGRLRPVGGPSARAAARAALDLPPDGLLVLFCGRLQPVKRLDVLAEACTASGARLVVVGEGPLAPELETRPATIVRAAVTDITPYLHAADVYASASQTEGLSNAMLEALACGVPVLSVPASGVRPLLSTGGGLVCPGPDAGDLAAGITALSDAEVRGAAGRAARRHVVAHHDLARTADALAALYRDLAGRALLPPTNACGAHSWARNREGSAEAVIRRMS